MKINSWQVLIMDGFKVLLVYTLLIVFCHLSYAQQKAIQKCKEYQKIPRSLRKPGHNIIGGYLTKQNEFPHMVALGYGPKNSIKWLCGGTIISENYVLTAAHCVSHKEFGEVKVVHVGSRNLKDDDGINIGISRRIKHPKYKFPSLYNDLALLQLRTKLQFSKSILPACLNTVFNMNLTNNKLEATGWGLLQFAGSPSDDLMKVELRLYPQRQCKENYSNISKRKLANGIQQSTQLCAGGGLNEEKDTCQGDSGGPLAMKTVALYTVIGVTSFGKGCGIANIPGVYTRISAFVPWIERIVWK